MSQAATSATSIFSKMLALAERNENDAMNGSDRIRTSLRDVGIGVGSVRGLKPTATIGGIATRFAEAAEGGDAYAQFQSAGQYRVQMICGGPAAPHPGPVASQARLQMVSRE